MFKGAITAIVTPFKNGQFLQGISNVDDEFFMQSFKKGCKDRKILSSVFSRQSIVFDF